MPTISIKGVELSYDLNGNQPDDNAKSLVLLHGAGGQKADWPIAWRSKDDITRDLGLTPKNHSNKLMRLRVLFQAIAVLVFVIIIWASRN